MYHAKERKSGRVVAAHNASAWGSYTCPVCKANVSLRSGDYRTAHFAHKPGQAKPECELFHTSDELRHVWRLSPEAQADEGPPIEPLRLSIELEPEYDSRRGPRKWVLRLTVPKSDDEHGIVSIDCGGGDLKKIALTKLALGAQTYLADPAAQDFVANWVSPEVRPRYRSAVEHRIPGLDHRTANLFSATGQKLKPQSSTLCWSQSYYFVWRADRPLIFPLSLLRHDLAVNRGWACSLIALPDKADPEIAAWLEQTCELPILRAKREWSMIYPAPYAVDDDGSLLVSSISLLLLATKAAEPHDTQAGDIACVVGQSSASASVPGQGRQFLEIAMTEGAQPKPVHLTWGGTPLATLITESYQDTASVPAIHLEFDVHNEIKKIDAHLHCASCQPLLGKVRTSELHLSKVRAYPALRGQFRWRRADQFKWQSEDLSFSDSGVHPPGTELSLPAQVVERINALLQDRSLDVDFDFGAFGQFWSLAGPETKERPAAVRIQRDLRARIEWLCKASGALVTAHRSPLGKLDDEALLLHFSDVSVPASLMAHRRAIERELRLTGRVLSS